MKKLSIFLALGLLLISVPVFGFYYAYLEVTESNGTSYENLALTYGVNVTYLADEGYIAANGTDTRITDSDFTALPHMLADDRLLWVGDVVANDKTSFVFLTEQSYLDSFPLITGHGGYVTINDTADLEPGDKYMFQIYALFDTSVGTNKSIIRKDNAVVFNVTGYQQLTFAVTGGNSLLLTGVTSEYHFIGVYCDGNDLWAEVDGVLKDTDTASAIPNTATDWYLFENDVCPYVAYYDEWIVTT